MKRRLTVIPTKMHNALWHMYDYRSFTKLFKNTLIIELARFVPSLKFKRWLYRHILKMTVGQYTAIAFKVTPDIFYPEKIRIGKNVIIGYNTTLLTHEFLTDALRVGEIEIGDDTMIGANVTVLPGVKIGARAKIGAGSVVSKDIPNDVIAYGNPIQIKEQ
ncbi:acyltransferase [Staphylococcus coagulans]|uniref:acyltransferase n=1 Tax=Staphylococcus TaxID=1279 RepID=UPI0013F42BC5|nr:MULTISPECIES: acyltransferase [Staphylococcus]NHA36421.1 acetyltransferase [Staphylococcus schleiferi]MBT2831207.1 acyltransferase [Staphylococcus coagulans]MBT2860673.1 acyltransferase [Staphylococcus coagulans]MBU3873764.1 acyltransferase [Staphylococcus coagulans]NHB70640.1 acetyltransferase [Staphylococcus sp. 191]